LIAARDQVLIITSNYGHIGIISNVNRPFRTAAGLRLHRYGQLTRTLTKPLVTHRPIWYKVRFCRKYSEVLAMSRVCQVTGKRPMTGNNVSHANNKTRRRFLPNLNNHRFWVESEGRWVKLRVSSKGMRIIDKHGIDKVLADIRQRGEKP